MALHTTQIGAIASPFVIAFASGGFFYDSTHVQERFRLIFVAAIWALVAIAAFVSSRPLPRAKTALISLGGLVLLTALTAASLKWAPLSSAAYKDLQRLVLYVGVFILALAVLGDRKVLRWLTPALLLGVGIVVLYGLSERFFPGLFELERNKSAGGRLEQPLTYWNAMGMLAVFGFLFATELLSNRSRSTGLRIAAACISVPIGLGVYLTFSRGALVALAVGLTMLFICRPTRTAIYATLATLLTAGVAALVASLFAPAIEKLTVKGANTAAEVLSEREAQGAIMFAVVVVLVAAIGLIAYAIARRVRSDDSFSPTLTRTMRIVFSSVIVLGVVAFLTVAATERNSVGTPKFGAETERLGTIESNRYAYWDVALRAFAEHPLAGVGSGGFRVEWLRNRPVSEAAKDAHSLYIETAAELGVIGLIALGLFIGGIVLAARSGYRRDPTMATVLIVGLTAFAVHAGLDWDWEMPTVTMIALLLGAALLNVSSPDRSLPPHTPPV